MNRDSEVVMSQSYNSYPVSSEGLVPQRVQSDAVDTLATSVGDFVKYWGFKRIHGQIWTHLYLSEEPLDAGQLIRRLGVSKALISMSLSDLLSHDVVLRAGKSAHGTQLYEANPSVVSVIVQVLEKRERSLIGRVEEALSQVNSLSTVEKQRLGLKTERLTTLKSMVSTADKCLKSIVRLQVLDCSVWKKISGIAGISLR